MRLIEVMKKAFTRADYAAKAALEHPGETRRAGIQTYSRWNRSPANAALPLRPGDMVLPSGQVVAKDAPPPPGERLVVNEWAAGNVDQEYAAAPSTEADGPTPDLFAARQALANRRTR